MVLWKSQLSSCSLLFWKAGRNAVQILIFTLVAESLGECCPNFDTLALFKRRGNAAQILTFILWLGHSLEHPKVAQITSKSTQNRPKIIKNWYLEWLWAPLGSPWRPLGHHLGPGCQKPSKKWLGGPPQEVPKEVMFEHCSILFRVPFLVPVLVPFLVICWAPWELKK